MLNLIDYDYDLPNELIAQIPVTPPESCKLIVVDNIKKTHTHHTFSDITDLIDADTLIVFNNSKVLKARLQWDGKEIFFLRSIDSHSFEAMVWTWNKFRVWSRVEYVDDIYFDIKEITLAGRIITCSVPILQVLETYWLMPLPPYIKYKKELEASYQPAIATTFGSVASPTASLHFTHDLIKRIESKWVQTLYTTLHIGIETFKPVFAEDITTHQIHSEKINISTQHFVDIYKAKAENKKILAVWTTVTRTLESLPYLWVTLQEQNMLEDIPEETKIYRDTLSNDITIDDASKIIKLSVTDQETWSILFDSKLFLYPGKDFYIIDELITNFHLPKSSLLMLVAGFMGLQSMKETYEQAIKHSYRFYSFGDAMWIR